MIVEREDEDFSFSSSSTSSTSSASFKSPFSSSDRILLSSWDWKALTNSQKYYGKIGLIICSGGILTGYAIGIISGTLMSIYETYNHPNLLSLGLVVATLSLGNLLGNCFTLQLVDTFGLVKILFLQNILRAIGALLISSSHQIEIIYLGRIILGLGMSSTFHLNQLYLSSIIPLTLQNHAISCYQLCVAFGIMISFLFSLIFHQATDWRFLFSFQVLLGGIYAILLIFLPESPKWLVNHGYGQYSREILSQIYETPLEIDEIITSYDSHLNLEEYKIKSFHLIKSQLSQYQICIVCITILLLIQHFTGSYILRNYSVYLFIQFGFTRYDALLFSLILGICHFLTIGWFLYQQNRVGRKYLFFRGLLFITLGQFLFFFLSFFFPSSSSSSSSSSEHTSLSILSSSSSSSSHFHSHPSSFLSILLLFSFLLITIGSSLCFEILLHIIQVEFFPLSLFYPNLFLLFQLLSTFFEFFSTLFFCSYLQEISFSLFFLINFFLCIFSCFFCQFILIETKDQFYENILIAIQRNFSIISQKKFKTYFEIKEEEETSHGGGGLEERD